MGVFVIKDGDFVLGSPGPVNWRGAIFMNSVVQSLEEANRWYQSAVEDPVQGKPGPEPAMSGYYSYLGQLQSLYDEEV